MRVDCPDGRLGPAPALSLTFQWIPCLLLPLRPLSSCMFAVSLQLPLQSLISPCSRWKSSTYLSFPCPPIPPSCLPLPNLFISKSDCTSLPPPHTPGPPSPFHNMSRPFFCQHCPICLCSSSFFKPDVCFSSPSSFFFPFQPSQSQQSLSSYHHGPCVFSKVPLRPTLIQ